MIICLLCILQFLFISLLAFLELHWTLATSCVWIASDWNKCFSKPIRFPFVSSLDNLLHYFQCHQPGSILIKVQHSRVQHSQIIHQFQTQPNSSFLDLWVNQSMGLWTLPVLWALQWNWQCFRPERSWSPVFCLAACISHAENFSLISLR